MQIGNCYFKKVFGRAVRTRVVQIVDAEYVIVDMVETNDQGEIVISSMICVGVGILALHDAEIITPAAFSKIIACATWIVHELISLGTRGPKSMPPLTPVTEKIRSLSAPAA